MNTGPSWTVFALGAMGGSPSLGRAHERHQYAENRRHLAADHAIPHRQQLKPLCAEGTMHRDRRPHRAIPATRALATASVKYFPGTDPPRILTWK
jgi:hypothetical protein